MFSSTCDSPRPGSRSATPYALKDPFRTFNVSKGSFRAWGASGVDRHPWDGLDFAQEGWGDLDRVVVQREGYAVFLVGEPQVYWGVAAVGGQGVLQFAYYLVVQFSWVAQQDEWEFFVRGREVGVRELQGDQA